MELLVALFGSAALASLLYAVWPRNVHPRVKYRKSAWAGFTAFPFAGLALHFVVLSGHVFSATVKQTGTLDLGDGTESEFEVLYPEEYTSLPRLNISFTQGYAHIQVVEKRSDGFKFTASEIGYDIADGVDIRWEASGK